MTFLLFWWQFTAISEITILATLLSSVNKRKKPITPRKYRNVQ